VAEEGRGRKEEEMRKGGMEGRGVFLTSFFTI